VESVGALRSSTLEQPLEDEGLLVLSDARKPALLRPEHSRIVADRVEPLS
jgi:hypothetical protein